MLKFIGVDFINFMGMIFVIRKLFSAYRRAAQFLFSIVRKKLIILGNSNVQISGTPLIENSIRISCTEWRTVNCRCRSGVPRGC